MGKINVIGKWNLEKYQWQLNPNEKEYGRSFAMATYDKVINNTGKIDYIIIAQGSRVEDHSKDYQTINEKK